MLTYSGGLPPDSIAHTAGDRLGFSTAIDSPINGKKAWVEAWRDRSITMITNQTAQKMDLSKALENEKIAYWYDSVNQLSTAGLHWKQQESLDKCVCQMMDFVEKKDWRGVTKVAAKYYKKASCQQMEDYIANAWDCYLTVLYLMGVEIPEELDLIEI